ncbi:MAG: Rieske 2Fe-2S domain-containing protein [Chloroflexota bacterium]|nr:Rieske 2Fe-2S domain-containing protein [Chloroflexota bacterium]
MLSVEDNELLTRVGPGTPMGKLMRRYWMPALLCAELPEPDSTPVRVRLLGEDLIAFRDTNGKVGVLAQNCPHRGASLFFGRNEECGLRCVYHGWKFDVEGSCVDMPNEPAESSFKHKVQAVAYPAHESGGIVWVYMGPRDMRPPFRDFGSESLPREQWQASKQISYCNYAQAMEGNLDTAHISFLHRSLKDVGTPADDTDRPGYPSAAISTLTRARDRSARIEVENTSYGFRYAGIRTTPNGYRHVRMSVFVMPIATFVAAIPFGSQCLMMVPIDDHTCWRMGFATHASTGLSAASVFTRPVAQAAGRVPGVIQRSALPENDYLIDRQAQRTESYTGITGIGTQDLAVTESMGPIYDRTSEHLGTTDGAIIRMRQMLIRAARELERGADPPGLDPSYPYDEIRSAEKILAPEEDWSLMATRRDERFLEELAAARG